MSLGDRSGRPCPGVVGADEVHRAANGGRGCGGTPDRRGSVGQPSRGRKDRRVCARPAPASRAPGRRGVTLPGDVITFSARSRVRRPRCCRARGACRTRRSRVEPLAPMAGLRSGETSAGDAHHLSHGRAPHRLRGRTAIPGMVARRRRSRLGCWRGEMPSRSPRPPVVSTPARAPFERGVADDTRQHGRASSCGTTSWSSAPAAAAPTRSNGRLPARATRVSYPLAPRPPEAVPRPWHRWPDFGGTVLAAMTKRR